MINGNQPKLIETWLVPEQIPFKCPECGAPCILYPRGQPMAAVHGMPTCSEWKTVEEGKRLLADYLKDAGVKMFGGDAP